MRNKKIIIDKTILEKNIKKSCKPKVRFLFSLSSFLILLFSFLFSSCIGMASSAEEYFSIGMAYYDLGKFEDAEKWLIRARQADRTYSASQYNLGRIAFERQRYNDAVKQFEGILRRDPNNLHALRAAAYTRIKMGDIETAQKHYAKILSLVPESADDGYNHALVLFAMERFSDAEETLDRYPFAMQDNKEMQLLHARAQGRQNKVEAIDSFATWLESNSDAKARYEYGMVLEHHELFARALEELRKALTEVTETSVDPHKYEIRFVIARILLIAEAGTNAGITELQGAIEDGYKDINAIEELLKNPKITTANNASLRTIAANLRNQIIEETIKANEEISEEEEEQEENEEEQEN